MAAGAGKTKALGFAGLDAYQQEKREQRRRSRLHGKAYLPELDSLHYVDHVVPWTLIMYYTGFRPGDITGLRWEHVIWHSDKTSIRKTIEKTAHHHPHPMTFPLSSIAADILSRWHQQQGRPPTGLAFPSPRTGQRLDSTAMQQQGTDLHILLCDAAGDLALQEYTSAEAINTPPSNPAGQVKPEGVLGMLMERGASVDVCAIYLPNSEYSNAALREGVGVAAPGPIAQMMRDPAISVYSF